MQPQSSQTSINELNESSRMKSALDAHSVQHEGMRDLLLKAVMNKCSVKVLKLPVTPEHVFNTATWRISHFSSFIDVTPVCLCPYCGITLKKKVDVDLHKYLHSKELPVHVDEAAAETAESLVACNLCGLKFVASFFHRHHGTCRKGGYSEVTFPGGTNPARRKQLVKHQPIKMVEAETSKALAAETKKKQKTQRDHITKKESCRNTGRFRKKTNFLQVVQAYNCPSAPRQDITDVETYSHAIQTSTCDSHSEQMEGGARMENSMIATADPCTLVVKCEDVKTCRRKASVISRQKISLQMECENLDARERLYRKSQEVETEKKGQLKKAQVLVPCKICNKVFRAKNVLSRHMRAYHTSFNWRKDVKMVKGELRDVYECPVCKRQVVYDGIRQHVRIHQERKHSCPTCDKKFIHKAHLGEHLLTHTQEQPYKCRFCNLAFRQRSTVHMHENRHIGAKKYKCAFCPQVVL